MLAITSFYFLKINLVKNYNTFRFGLFLITGLSAIRIYFSVSCLGSSLAHFSIKLFILLIYRSSLFQVDVNSLLYFFPCGFFFWSVVRPSSLFLVGYHQDIKKFVVLKTQSFLFMASGFCALFLYSQIINTSFIFFQVCCRFVFYLQTSFYLIFGEYLV